VGSDFIRKVAETMATRISLVGIGLVTSVIIARSLGPEGRGLVASVGAITALGVQFGNLGLHASNTYYVARQPEVLPTLVGNSLAVGFGGATLLAFGAWIVMVSWPSLSPLPWPLLALALAGIPFGLGYLLLQNLLLGINQVRSYNVIELGGRILLVALLGALIAVARVSAWTVAGTGLLISALSGAWALRDLWPHLKTRLRMSPRLLRRHLRYGSRAYFAAFFSYTVIRADVLMCSFILGAEDTGLYSIAVAMADLLMTLPIVVGTIAFPRLAGTHEPLERWTKAMKITKGLCFMLVIMALVAAALARPVVGLLYGEDFLPSVPAFQWLLPGIIFLGVNSILMNYLGAEGMPPVVVWSPAVASVVNISLNLLLLSRLGIIGASISSSIAYGLMLFVSAAYLRRRRPGRPAAELPGR
jgi:O-antigen/teichoic acid export membrane protein